MVSCVLLQIKYIPMPKTMKALKARSHPVAREGKIADAVTGIVQFRAQRAENRGQNFSGNRRSADRCRPAPAPCSPRGTPPPIHRKHFCQKPDQVVRSQIGRALWQSVFDEWAGGVPRGEQGAGAGLHRSAERRFPEKFLSTISARCARNCTMPVTASANFAFARHGVGTSFEAFMVLGMGI